MIPTLTGVIGFVAGYLFHKFLAARLEKKVRDGAVNLAGRI